MALVSSQINPNIQWDNFEDFLTLSTHVGQLKCSISQLDTKKGSVLESGLKSCPALKKKPETLDQL